MYTAVAAQHNTDNIPQKLNKKENKVIMYIISMLQYKLLVRSDDLKWEQKGQIVG